MSVLNPRIIGIYCVLFTVILLKEYACNFSIDNIHSDSDNGIGVFEIMKLFLETHIEHCDHVQLCTVKVPDNNASRVTDGRCCHHCSCEPDCKQSNTCCPDIWIRDVIPDVVFDSSEELLGTLKNNSDKIKHILENLLTKDNLEVKQQINPAEECVSTWLFTHRDSQTSGGLDAYFMVSRCPVEFGNSNEKEIEIKLQCERPARIGELSVKLFADTLIPLSSSKTGVTYKNMYCLQCNEGTRSGIPWSSWFTSSLFEIFKHKLFEPRIMFHEINKMTYSNIIFKPPNVSIGTKNIDFRKCNFAHISNCSNEWLAATSDTYTKHLYEHVCNNIYNPVVHVTKRKKYRIIYNNIVCNICNYVENESCTESGTGYPMVELNTGYISEASPNTGPVPLNIITNNGSLCSKGYVYDTIDNQCRMLYCPKNFFNENGECVPNILHTSGLYYSIKLVVTNQPSNMMNESTRAEFEQRLYEFLKSVLSKNFKCFLFKIWRQGEDDAIVKHLIFMSFRKEATTHVDVLQLIQKIIPTINVSINNKIIPIIFTFLKYDMFSLTSLTRKFSSGYDQFDKSKKKQINLVYEFDSGTENFTKLSNFEISRIHNCYRVMINRSQLVFRGRSLALLHRTNVILQGIDLDFAYDFNFVYVCIKDFLNVNINFWPSSSEGMSPTQGGSVVTEESSYVEIEIVAAFGGGIVCILIVLLYRSIARRVTSCRQT